MSSNGQRMMGLAGWGRSTLASTLCGWLLMAPSVAPAEEWRQFRGGTGSQVAATGPRQWNESEGVAWKTLLPGKGLSSPVVLSGGVFVSASSGPRQDRLHVVRVNEESGEIDWHRQFLATGRTTTHNATYNAAPSPCSDGERIFALYSSGDCVCLDLQGNLLWFRGLNVDYPNASNSLGMASSPVVVGDVLVVQLESDSQSVALGLDVQTGESRWTQQRPKRANWTSPVILESPDRPTLVLLMSSAGVAAVRPETGETVWSFDQGASTIPSVTVGNGLVFVPSNGLVALNPESSANPAEVWKTEQLAPATGSPLVVGSHVYILNRAGVLVEGDSQTGKVGWRTRLTGPFSGSPVGTQDGLIYAVNQEGVVQVVQTSDGGGEVVLEQPLGEEVQSTPALANGALYIRGLHHVWKITGTAPAAK